MRLYFLPQILSSIAVATFCFLNGLELSYLSILIPYFTNNDTRVENSFAMSDNEKSWLLSIGPIVKPLGCVLAGLVMDHIGRLNTLRVAVLPWSIGWLLIAKASSFLMIAAGFTITIFSFPWLLITAVTYITEISSPSVRGMLVNLKTIFWCLGSMAMFLLGAFLHWRTIAWINCLLPLAPLFLSLLLKESMLWLVTRGRFEDAKKSLVYFNRYRKTSRDENFDCVIDRKLLMIQTLHDRYRSINLSLLQKLKFFLQPSGYKRVLMVAGLEFFQNLSGSIIVFSNIMVFFNEFGTTINPYAVGIYLGLTKLVITFCNIWLLKTFRFRIILIASYLIISGCLVAFGLYIDFNPKDSSIYQWIPLCALILYSNSMVVGPYSVPVVLTPSVYPTHIRGTGQSVSSIIGHMLEFFMIQSYYAIKKVVKQSHILYFMSFSSLIACVYIYSWVVETRQKTFLEIENYFVKKDNKSNPRSLEEQDPCLEK
uniref:Major facilitator superfamily (MFS) profile domain-containing protein n=1 Tax=Photinus pyralis TaxID=7054 RepID=A0A1Y1L8W0_PHOPY